MIRIVPALSSSPAVVHTTINNRPNNTVVPVCCSRMFSISNGLLLNRTCM